MVQFAIEDSISGNKQYDGKYANWYWTVSDYLNLANKRITATITGEGTEYLKVALYNADYKHVDVSGSIVTDSKTDYNRICVYIATNDTVSNIDAHITISVTDEHISDTTFYPYTPTVNDRLLALEGLIKKKTFNNTTSSSTGGYDTHMTGIIPLSASCSNNISGSSIRCFCWVSYGGNIDITFFNDEHTLIKNQLIGDVTLYYLEIPSDYTIPNVTPASDESEDD